MEPILILILALWAICHILSMMAMPDPNVKNFIYLLCIVLIIVFAFMGGYHSRGILFGP